MKKFQCTKKCEYFNQNESCCFTETQLKNREENWQPICLGGNDVTLEDLKEITEIPIKINTDM